MDLDEWYETVQRWRAPATRRRWRRVPPAVAAALLALTVAVAATQLSDGPGRRSVGPLAAAPLALPVEDTPGVTTTTATSTAAPAPATAPAASALAAPTLAPATAPPTTVLSAPATTDRPAPPPTTAAPAPPSTTAAAPPTTAAPGPPPSTPPNPPPGPPPKNTGRLSANMGARPMPAGVGQPVTFTATWSDSNGVLASMGIEFGDGGGDHRTGGPCGPGPAGPHSGSEGFTHAFAAPGTYVVRLHVHTDDCTGGRQATVVTLTVRVQ